MAAKTHPWTDRLLELLSDGEWHDYVLLRDEAARMVPPGIAFRQAESGRIRHYVDAGRDVKDRAFGNKEDTILTGQRAFVMKSLQSLRRNGKIEVEYGVQPRRKRPVRVRLVREGIGSDEDR